MNCSFSPRFVVLLIWAVWLMLPTAASSQGKADEHTTLSLISEQDAIVRGKQLWIGIRFEADGELFRQALRRGSTPAGYG